MTLMALFIQQTLKGAKHELRDAQEAATPIQPCHILLEFFMFRPQGGLVFLGGMPDSIFRTFAPWKLLISRTYLCTRPRLVYPKHKPARQRFRVIPELDKNFAVS